MERLTQDFESILEKYKKHKLETYKVLELLGGDYVFNDFGADTTDKRYTALYNCGTTLLFGKTSEEGRTVYHLRGANFCRQRLCPMCQFRRSERIFSQMLQVVQHLESGYRFLHLVLTVPNQQNDFEVVQAVKLLYKGFSIFYGYKNIRRAFKGVLRCLEISYNYTEDTFHPHLHCLVAVRKSYFNDSKVYLSYDIIRELWTKAIKKAVDRFGEPVAFIDENTPLLQIHIGACKVGDYSGVAEVCKYSLKPLSLDNDGTERQYKRVLLTLWHTLKGTRFLQKYGVIKEAFNELFGDDAPEELTEGAEETNEVKRFFAWSSELLTYRGD